MVENFCLDNSVLNDEERVVLSTINEIKKRYATICLSAEPKKYFDELKSSLVKSSPAVLQAFARCCVETNNFVPIEKFTIGEWKDDFSYQQRFAMWQGTGFKGIFAYGEEFIREALEQDVPVCPNLWKIHSQMQVKDFPVKDIYKNSIWDSLKDQDKKTKKITLWNSDQQSAKDFRTAVFQDIPELKDVFDGQAIRRYSYSYMNYLRKLIGEKDSLQNS